MPDHRFAHRIIELYEQHARAWDDQRNRRLMERDWLDRFVALLPAHAQVLDIGCGMGEPIASTLLARGLVVTGVDSSPTLISLCRERMPQASWHVADMRTLELGNRFDGLLAWNSVFHLTPDDQRGMFAIFARHAKPRAALMFTSGPEACERLGSWQGEPLYHASLAADDYRGLLAQHGFEVVAFVPEDPACGAHTVWLAQVRG